MFVCVYIILGSRIQLAAPGKAVESATAAARCAGCSKPLEPPTSTGRRHCYRHPDQEERRREDEARKTHLANAEIKARVLLLNGKLTPDRLTRIYAERDFDVNQFTSTY